MYSGCSDLTVVLVLQQVVSPAQVDKYDPAEPCDDSSSREVVACSPGQHVNSPDQDVRPGSPSQHFDSSSSMPEGAVSKAVKEVLKVGNRCQGRNQKMSRNQPNQSIVNHLFQEAELK